MGDELPDMKSSVFPSPWHCMCERTCNNTVCNGHQLSMTESSHFHLSREGETHVETTVMRAVAQAADATSLSSSSSSCAAASPTSSSPLSSRSVSRGRPHQAHHRGTEPSFALPVILHFPQEGSGLGEGGHWVPHEAGWGSVDGRRV